MSIHGTLDIRNWDEGCFLTLGTSIVYFQIDGETRGQHVLNIPGLDSGIEYCQNKVPVFFDSPEDPYGNYILPSIVFKMNDLSEAFDRQPWYGWIGRAPAYGAKEIILPDGRKGYDKYRKQWRDEPWNISYDCVIHARRKQESNLILMEVKKKIISPWFIFKVIDSLGDVRQYDAGDVSISNAAELMDISERQTGWTISFVVRGEITIHEEREESAMLNPTIRTKIKTKEKN